jgi:acyl carrier protein
MTNYETEIREFIAEELLFGEGRTIDPKVSLLEAGIIDSTGILELISFLEEKYKIRVGDDELVPQNLDTIAGICAYLDKKRT